MCDVALVNAAARGRLLPRGRAPRDASTVGRVSAVALLQQFAPVDEHFGNAPGLARPRPETQELGFEQQQQFHEALLVGIVEQRREDVRHEGGVFLPGHRLPGHAERVPVVVQHLIETLKKLGFELIG